MRKPQLLTTFAGIALLWALHCADAAPAPKATAILGKLTGAGYAKIGNTQPKLANGMKLNVGDTIILRNGKLSLRMADGTTIKLAGPAEFTIDGKDAKGRTRFTATKGRVLVQTQQRTGDEVRVETPSATLAIRGSTAGVDASEAGTLCWCDEGIVYIDAAGERILLRSGYQTYVNRGEPPPPPTPISEGTHVINEGLDLEASINQTPETTGTSGMQVAGGVTAGDQTEEQIANEHITAANDIINNLYSAYEHEDLNAVVNLLASNFATNDNAGTSRNISLVQESFRQDFTNLENIRFFRQSGGSRRYYKDHDEVSARERWVMNAILPSGARLQQAGETYFTIGSDAGAGGLRVTRWEGDCPFGRFHPSDEDMKITSPTVITPPASNAPDIVMTQGTLAAGGGQITGSDARVFSGGVQIQATDVTLTPGGGVSVQNATFQVNGTTVTAGSIQIQSNSSFTAQDVHVTSGGVQVEAETLTVSGGTVTFTNATVTDSQGQTVTLAEGTIISPSQSGTTSPIITGTTPSGETVTATAGKVVVVPPPGAPLPAGRGEKLVDGEGFQFATELVTNGPADLYFTGGKLVTEGVVDMGVMLLSNLAQAPTSGYQLQVTVGESLAGHVLAVQTESGKYAKILVRAGTTPTQLVFDWVYNPDGSTALTRGRKWPTRAQVVFNSKVYDQQASGSTMLHPGVENITEMRMETSKNLSNGASVEAYLAPRLSTDRQVDNKSLIMDRFGVKYFQPGEMELSIGDLSGEFTPYTLNQSLLGLSAWKTFGIGPAGTARLTAVVGPRWQPGAGFKFDGWVTGLRLATDDLRDLGPYVEDAVVGVNMVTSHKTTSSGLSSTVFSVDATTRLKNGLALSGEWAMSQGQDAGQSVHGDALLLRGAYRIGDFRFILDRERVGTGFRTVSGSAANDEERTNAWIRFCPNDWFNFNFNFLYTRDNLDNSKPYTTCMSVPRYGFSITPFYPLVSGGFLRNFTLDFLLRHNIRTSDDALHTLDKKYRTITISAIQRIGDFYLTVGRDEERELDFATSGTSRRGLAVDVSLRWRPKGILPIPFSPVFGIRRGRDLYDGPYGPITSNVNSNKFGLEIGDPNSIAVELGYELFDNSRTDFGGYNRRVMNIDLTRALDKEGSRTATLSWNLLSNKQESDARSYTEGQLTGSVSQKF